MLQQVPTLITSAVDEESEQEEVMTFKNIQPNEEVEEKRNTFLTKVEVNELAEESKQESSVTNEMDEEESVD